MISKNIIDKFRIKMQNIIKYQNTCNNKSFHNLFINKKKKRVKNMFNILKCTLIKILKQPSKA